MRTTNERATFLSSFSQKEFSLVIQNNFDNDNSNDDDHDEDNNDDVDTTSATVKMSIFVSIKNSQGCSGQLDCRHFVDLWFDARLQQMEFRQPLVRVIDPDEKLECFILSKNKFAS